MPRSSRPAPQAGRCDPTLLSDDEIIALLRSGDETQVLAAYFGTDEFRELRPLAKLAATRKVRSRGSVYLLPGIMGSKLGTSNAPHRSSLWLCPHAIERGELLGLALPAKRRLVTQGVILPTYLRLKLMLQIAGFAVTFHAYDWRQSLKRSGEELADRIMRDGSTRIMIVAHSMGGLVARAALNVIPRRKITALIQLGAPNLGSFAPLQAMRAVYPTVRKLASLDPSHSAEDLAQRVFSTLPGLYQLLPQQGAEQTTDFFDPLSWPQNAVVPDSKLLHAARNVTMNLAPADERCFVIAGVGQPTVTRVIKRTDGFDYVYTNDGDGTVPLALAKWPNAQTRFVNEAHGALTKNRAVCAAVIDLLSHGHTRQLLSASPASGNVTHQVSEEALRKELLGKLRWSDLPLEERRRILEPTISPEFRRLICEM